MSSASSVVKNADKLVVIVPCQDRIVPETEVCLRELERQCVRVHRAFDQSAIDLSRSRLATQALRAGYQEILWIDSDVGFAVQDVERLRKCGLPFVGGIYPKKGAVQLACAQLPTTRSIRFDADAVPIEVQYIGAGFLYTRAEVYRAIQHHFDLPLCHANVPESALVPYFCPTVITQGNEALYLAEDFAFCHRAREAGIAVMADPGIRLAHYGRYGWTLEDCLNHKVLQPMIELSFTDGPVQPREERGQ